MPNIDDSNKPIQPQKPIGKSQQKPQETAEVPSPPNPEDITPQTDLRKDPLAVIGRSAIDVKHPLDPKTQANIAKDVAALNEFFEENRDFADFLKDIYDAIHKKHPDWTQDQVMDLTIQIGQELEKQLKSA